MSRTKIVVAVFAFLISPTLFAQGSNLSTFKNLQLGMTLTEFQRLSGSYRGTDASPDATCRAEGAVVNCNVEGGTVANVPASINLEFVAQSQAPASIGTLHYVDAQLRLAQIRVSVSSELHDTLRDAYAAKFGKPHKTRNTLTTVDSWRDTGARAELSDRCELQSDSCLVIKSLALAPALVLASQRADARLRDL
jgi:hypothetical protein